jgi:dipeptidyl aminopeptidase/acylaminoacyl peptidase
MSRDRFDVLERFTPLFEAPEPSFEGFVRRRDRKRRNQRISAGVVGIAVFLAAAWIATTGGPFDRTRTPAVPGPTVPRATGVPKVDYAIDLNTGVMTPLSEMTPLPEGFRPHDGPSFENQYAVSPDGSLLAYVGTGDETQIFIAGIDGTGVRQVTHDPNGAFSPAWSPEGTRIAYGGSDRGHVRGLFVLDVASGESTQIITRGNRVLPLEPQVLPLEPQFTPDGSSLVYTGGSDRHPVIQIVSVAGGESTPLIGPGGNLRDASNGSLSPDGALVTFLGTPIGRPEPQRWVANADGTGRRLLPDVYGIPCRSNPAGTWSSDGSRIVCAEASRVIVVDIATGVASPVAVGRGAIWLDDDTLLVSL